ncbi:MAG: septum formation initiator [Sulfurospirillaceae bacterium]|nr:septum formation initiator [Sulfurospirillaceae bacterium]MDD3462474.1 septum formation initiator [Sulfurospirillaceae bacterium]
MSDILEEFDKEGDGGKKEAFLFYIKSLLLIGLVLGFGLYVGDVLFGKSSLDVLLNLQEDKETLVEKIRGLKEENAVLQKEFFELRRLDPDK